MKLLSLLEPEEAVGRWWHQFAGDRDSFPHFPEAAVSLSEIERELHVFFRGLGGGHGIEIKVADAPQSRHRLGFWQRLGRESERISRASFNGERFLLPDRIDLLPDAELNRRLYFWLSAWTVASTAIPLEMSVDPLAADLFRLRHAIRAQDLALSQFPGLKRHYSGLREAILNIRPPRKLPCAETDVENAIRALLGDGQASSPFVGVILGRDKPEVTAPRDYRPYLPLALWGDVETAGVSGSQEDPDDEDRGSGKQAGGDRKTRRAKRQNADQINRQNGLVIHRFDKILSWAEFMNLHRDTEDDEENQARKASEDHDELGVAQIRKRAATKLKFDLDLSPKDVIAEELSDRYVYPEWDYRSNRYLPRNVRVLARIGDSAPGQEGAGLSAETKRRIRHVRRQFEALRPKRQLLRAQLDGSEYDIDGLVRSQIDLHATGEPGDRIYIQARAEMRDLAVAALIDVSRSTEAFVGERAVIDVEKEALIALSEGLAACQDDFALYAFSSLRRDRVWVTTLKDFKEPNGPAIRARIGCLTPGHYTRLGGAIRHVSSCLAKRENSLRLLLVISDGKPNDLDHYEGRYGIEDSRKAIFEARAQGQAVFGIAVDRDAGAYIPRIFGAGAYAIVSKPGRLTNALPYLYRQMVRS
jgi:nitric oxide reductase NorD protein